MDNEYKAKQETRRDRIEAQATKARAGAIAAGEQRRRIGAMIPMGQPILVGHRSEKKHRRDIARIDAGFRREYEGHEKAKKLDRQAAALGCGGDRVAGNSVCPPIAAALVAANVGQAQQRLAA